MGSDNVLTVYYDGLCKVCSKEINHYKKQKGAEKISFIDICSDQFDATAEKLDPFEIHKIMHVRKSDGTLAVRVDAFIEIWRHIPRYQFLVPLAENRLVKSILELGYSGFVQIRPLLPRYQKNNQCADSPYCEIKKA